MAYLPYHLNSARGFEASNESPVSKDQIESHWLLKGPQASSSYPFLHKERLVASPRNYEFRNEVLGCVTTLRKSKYENS